MPVGTVYANPNIVLLIAFVFMITVLNRNHLDERIRVFPGSHWEKRAYLSLGRLSDMP